MNTHLIYFPDIRIFRCKKWRCDSTENKSLIQISKYKYNNNNNNDKEHEIETKLQFVA